MKGIQDTTPFGSRVIHLNNQGVRSLQQKDYRKALKTFLTALGHQKEAVKARQQRMAGHDSAFEKYPSSSSVLAANEQHELSHNTGNLYIGQSVSGGTTSLMTQDRTSNNKDNGNDDDEANHFQMFDRVFLLAKPQDPTAAQNRDGTSAIILYNMAVAHHMRGLQHQHHPQRLELAKAVRLYQWALSALQHWDKASILITGSQEEEEDGCQCRRNCPRHILRLAILNNMAHAYYSANRMDDAVHSLKCLRDILAYAKGYVTRDDYAFFSGNMVVALCQKSGTLVMTPAAAA